MASVKTTGTGFNEKLKPQVLYMKDVGSPHTRPALSCTVVAFNLHVLISAPSNKIGDKIGYH